MARELHTSLLPVNFEFEEKSFFVCFTVSSVFIIQHKKNKWLCKNIG